VTARVHAHAFSLPLSFPLLGGPGLSAPTRPHVLSLAVPWDLPVSADRPFALVPSLCPVDPTCQPPPPVTNLPPTPPPWMATSTQSLATSARPRPFRARTLLAHFPLLICALSRALLPCAHLGTSAAAHRSPSFVLRPPSSPRRARCLGEFCLAMSNSGHPSIRPQSLWFARSALTGVLSVQPELRHRRPEASLHLRHCSGTPVFPLEVSNLPAPLCLCYCPGLRVVARWSRFTPSWNHPTVFCALCASTLVLCPRLCSPDCPEYAQVLPQVPRALPWPLPSSLRDPTARSSGTAAPSTSHPDHAGRWISDIHPRYGC
jgi:hypothetical protein